MKKRKFIDKTGREVKPTGKRYYPMEEIGHMFSSYGWVEEDLFVEFSKKEGYSKKEINEFMKKNY